jgi:hypothetical protein
MDTSTSSIAVVKREKTRFEQYSEQLRQQPIIQSLLEVQEQLADSPVGQQAAQVRDAAKDKKEELVEKWETSQHPLVYNASYAVDAIFSENEHGRAINKLL